MRFENLATRLFFGAAVAALIAVAAPSNASASADFSAESLGCGGPGSPVCAATTSGKTTFYDYYN